MRKIAADALEELCVFSPDQEDELVTSVMRQWLTYEGHAVLVTEQMRFYLQVSEKQDSFGLQLSRVEGNCLQAFMRDWHIDLQQTEDILHSLNICQSAEFVNTKGKTLRLSVNPKDRSVRIEDPSEPKKQSAPPGRRRLPLPFCPRCTAVLKPWPPGVMEQVCPHCKTTVRLRS